MSHQQEASSGAGVFQQLPGGFLVIRAALNQGNSHLRRNHRTPQRETTMGQGEENDSPSKAFSVSCGQWLSQLDVPSPVSLGAAPLDHNPGSWLGPDTLLAGNNTQDCVLQSSFP